MDNSFISKFINSTDIARYLRDINYQFSVPEYAFLIWQCRRIPISKRHDRFRQLISTTETCTITTSLPHPDGTWDLHKTIKSYVALEDLLIQRLESFEEGCFYTVHCLDFNEWHRNGFMNGGGCYFKKYEEAYDYAKNHAEKVSVRSFLITKNFIDNSLTHSSEIIASYNYNGEMMEIDLSGELFNNLKEFDPDIWSLRFDHMWFDIPIPFKKGDILCDYNEGIPFVITDTVPWARKEHPPKNNSTQHLTYMDMTASGYSIDSETLSVKYNWSCYPYLNLRYYDHNLNGSTRILYAYSLYQHGKINGDTFTKLVQLLTAENQALKYYRDLDYPFAENDAKILGIQKYRNITQNQF